MLEYLAAVDWSTLEHAYGSADDLPDLLRAAASEDEDVRQEAVHELYGTVWHQGTVYSATPYAVPFLAELAEGGPGDRGDMLGLLACVVAGDSHSGGDAEAVKAGRRAVFALLPRLLRLVDDPDADVRRGLLRLVAACESEGRVALPVLNERLAHESDPRVRADIVTVLSVVDPASADRGDRNRDLMADPDPAVRLAAMTEVLRGTPLPYPLELVAEAVSTFVSVPPEQRGFLPEEHKGFEELLVDDPDAAVFAARRSMQTEHGLMFAWGVDEAWRDREVDVLPLYFEGLAQRRDDGRRSHELYRTARAVAALPKLHQAYEQRLLAFAADSDPSIRAAAVTALTRGRSGAAAAHVVGLIEKYPDEYGTGLAVTAAMESLGTAAEPVALTVAERLRAPSRRPTDTSNQEIALVRSLASFPHVAVTVVDVLTEFVEHGPCPNAAALVLTSLGRQAESASDVLKAAASDALVDEDIGLALVAAIAHFRTSGDATCALDVFRKALALRGGSYALGRVGELGAAASPFLPDLEAALETVPGRDRLGVAESIWRISGRTEDTLPVIAAHALVDEHGIYGAAQSDAVRVMTDMAAVPERLLPGLREFADSRRRIVYDGRYDGTPHDDTVARAAVRRLLETAVASALPVTAPESAAHAGPSGT